MSSNWKKVIVSPQDTIKQALSVIDSEALRIALVVNHDNKFIGTVTDGDIRRGFLNGVGMEGRVDSVMNSAPTVVSKGLSRNELASIMEAKNILSLPIVEDGELIGLETLHDVLQQQRYDNPVFLMAGGFGTRLRPLTDNCPKPLLKVGNKPILETTLINFVKSGFHNFYISTHYMSEMIREHFGDGSKWGVNISYIHEDMPLGTAGALGLLPKSIESLPLIMMNGDILTNIDFQKLLEFHNTEKADATMCVREYSFQIPYGIVKGKDGTVEYLEEKPVQKFHVNAGIYILNPCVLGCVSANQKVDMPDLLESQMKSDRKVKMFPIHEYWLDIGRMDDFHRAQQEILDLEV